VQAVLKFVETRQCEAKKGLFVWGDNDPYNADANAILQRLPFFKGAVDIFITTFHSHSLQRQRKSQRQFHGGPHLDRASRAHCNARPRSQRLQAAPHHHRP